MTTQARKKSKGLAISILAIAGVITVWAGSALCSDVVHAKEQTSGLLNFLNSIGLIKTKETLVDFYTYIKGVEYLLVVIFLCFFPLYYKFLGGKKGN